jgi:ankyrin repeat protein
LLIDPAVPEAPPADIALYNLKLVEALRLEDRDQLKRLLDAQAAREAEAASGASSTRSSINDHRSSALHLAVQMVSRELVEFLLEFQHLDVNQRDSDGNTPLHLAAQAGRTDVVRELLEKREVNVAIRNDEGLMAVDVARGAEIVNLIVGKQ